MYFVSLHDAAYSKLSIMDFKWRSLLFLQLFTTLGLTIQGLKKVLSRSLGQVGFAGRQVTFHSHLPEGEGFSQVDGQLN